MPDTNDFSAREADTLEAEWHDGECSGLDWNGGNSECDCRTRPAVQRLRRIAAKVRAAIAHD